MKSTLTASCSFESSLPFSSAIFSISRLLFYRSLYITFLFSLRGKKNFLFSFFVCFPEVPYMALTLARAHKKKKRKIQTFHQMWIIPSIITSKMQKYTKSSMSNTFEAPRTYLGIKSLYVELVIMDSIFDNDRNSWIDHMIKWTNMHMSKAVIDPHSGSYFVPKKINSSS